MRPTHISPAQQIGELACVNLVALVAFLQQSVFPWIAHDELRDVLFLEVIQLIRPVPSSKVTCKSPRSPWINCRMVLVLVSTIDSITSFPSPFITAIVMASL